MNQRQFSVKEKKRLENSLKNDTSFLIISLFQEYHCFSFLFLFYIDFFSVELK